MKDYKTIIEDGLSDAPDSRGKVLPLIDAIEQFRDEVDEISRYWLKLSVPIPIDTLDEALKPIVKLLKKFDKTKEDLMKVYNPPLSKRLKDALS